MGDWVSNLSFTVAEFKFILPYWAEAETKAGKHEKEKSREESENCADGGGEGSRHQLQEPLRRLRAQPCPTEGEETQVLCFPKPRAQ